MNGSTEFNTVEHIRLINEKTGVIKRLDGFKKTHRVPDRVSDRDQAFLAEIMDGELNDDLEEVFKALRSVYGFKRRDLSVSGPEEGCGAISTPMFNYEIAVSQVDDEPSEYCLARRITEIRQPNEALGDEFETVFSDQFRVLEIAAENDFDLEAIIDRVEDAEADSVSIDFDKDVSWCKIQVGSVSVLVSGKLIRIENEKNGGPKGLLEAFWLVQRDFIDKLDLGTEWFAQA